MKHQQIVTALMVEANIQINGNQPWDIIVHDSRFYKKVATEGSLGFGEAYINGWWDSDQPAELFFRIFKARLPEKVRNNRVLFFHLLKARLLNLQNLTRAQQVGKEHYDLSSKFYEFILGKSMAYTCAYWKTANTLDEAQYHKYDLICKKLHLQEGEHVLELGCGFGGFAKYAAENYGCHVTGISISKEQVDYASELCKGLPVKIYHCDYRNTEVYNKKQQVFDKIVSIGLVEHIGPKNYLTYFKNVHRQLKEDGLSLLHAIGSDVSKVACDPFTHKYLFPNSVQPSIQQLSQAAENLLVIEDVHNIGTYYYNTLNAWYNNLTENWSAIQEITGDTKFDERFFRIWCFYLLASMGMAKSKYAHLWQIVFSKRGSILMYEPIR